MEPLPNLGPLSFLLELDGLKEVWRKNPLNGTTRNENSAEHSWHGGLAALALAPMMPAGVDAHRVSRMMLVHDLGEIDTGDVLAYIKDEVQSAHDEHACVVRILGLLPESFRPELLALWDEFEDGKTSDARCAWAIDRLLPCLENVNSQGGAWLALGVRRDQALGRNAMIGEFFPSLWVELEPRIQAIFDAAESVRSENSTVREPPIPLVQATRIQ